MNVSPSLTQVAAPPRDAPPRAEPLEFPPDAQELLREREALKPRTLRVVVPYTRVHPGVELAIHSAGYEPELRETPGFYGYWELLCELWADGRDFVLIEHDIIAGPEVFENFETCTEWWCANPYNLGRAVIELYAFGCVRFRSEAMERWPRAFDYMPEEDRFWETLDERVQWQLQWLGATRHAHRPAVVNLNSRYFRGVYDL